MNTYLVYIMRSDLMNENVIIILIIIPACHPTIVSREAIFVIFVLSPLVQKDKLYLIIVKTL